MEPVAIPSDPTYDWPSVFRRGDLVRSTSGHFIGVVVSIINYGDDVARWELFVDGEDGIGVCEPWRVVVSNDAESIAQAKRLELRGLADEE